MSGIKSSQMVNKDKTWILDSQDSIAYDCHYIQH